MLDSVTLAAIIISFAVIFSTLLASYFVVLRAWSIERTATADLVDRAIALGNENLEFVRALPDGNELLTAQADQHAQKQPADRA